MIPTYVFGWPTGQETGEFLALDLGTVYRIMDHNLLTQSGGTNLRVCLVTLNGDGKFEITQSKYRLTEEQKQDEGQKLFDFCAECIKTFIESNMGRSGEFLAEGNKIPLGFTVSSDHLIKSQIFGLTTTTVLLPCLVSRHQNLIFASTYSSSSQERIDHGVLIRWTKGFGAPNTEGRDVAAMFRTSLDKHVRNLLPATFVYLIFHCSKCPWN
jgi:hexokinase